MAKKTVTNQADLIVGALALFMVWVGVQSVVDVFNNPGPYTLNHFNGYIPVLVIIFGSMIFGVAVHRVSARNFGDKVGKKGKK